ncbi:MAG: endolytic transglycosylase MltG [bacterium]
MESSENRTELEMHEPVSPIGRNRLRAFFVVFLLALGFVWFAIKAPSDFPKEGATITITSGESLKSVGTKLQNANIIRSRVLFSSIVTFLGGERNISPGDYVVKSGETLFAIAQQIALGQHGVDQIKITIPEGETNAEVADTIAKKIPTFDTKTFLAISKSNEGYLFPETYYVYPTITPEELRKEMLAMFSQQTKAVLTQESEKGKSQSDIVIMASLIEREAHGSDDRTTISGILWNRIANGMALQVDATVAYASKKSDTELQKNDFLIDSPYNTYKYKGLPPAPIANPGLMALKAAIHPAQTDYLYYLHDKHGTIHYAKTYAEHLKNIARYLK